MKLRNDKFYVQYPVIKPQVVQIKSLASQENDSIVHHFKVLDDVIDFYFKPSHLVKTNIAGKNSATISVVSDNTKPYRTFVAPQKSVDDQKSSELINQGIILSDGERIKTMTENTNVWIIDEASER